MPGSCRRTSGRYYEASQFAEPQTQLQTLATAYTQGRRIPIQ